MMFLKTVERFIEDKQLLSHNGLHIVALSGGPDSVALLLALKRLGYTVEAAHCNFHLRGAESDRDEQFVVSLCKNQEVPLHLIHFDTKAYAEIHQVSIEMAARELRYRYFRQLRTDVGAYEVCVAHHQDDAVETLLMNLIRGTGIHGLTGIRPRNGHIVRPLLCVNRADILKYLDSIGQSYVVDSSNQVADVVRNKLRLQVVPLLQQINSAASDNIFKTASRLAEVERVFNHSMESAISELLVNNKVNISRLLAQPSPEYLLFELLSPRQFTPSQIQQVFNSLTGPTGRLFQSPTHEVVTDRGQLLIEERHQPLPPLRVPETGTYQMGPSMKFRFSTTEAVRISKSPDCATLDADKVKFPLTVRHTQQGDRFHPYGMKGSRLVSDFLTDRKRSLIEKRRALVITDATGAILWLVGERTDQHFAVDATTQRLIVIEHLMTSSQTLHPTLYTLH